jgi:IS5 family transposase
MEKQQTFKDMEYAQRRRVSRREAFLETMNSLVPWQRLEDQIRPHYFAGKRGRPPKGIQPMPRMDLPQVWFSLADEAAEEQIYRRCAMRKFMGIDFTEEGAPDAAAPLNFRHFLEDRGPQKALFETVNKVLEEHGKIMRGGSILDAVIIEAPSSTKNSAKSRDPEMHQAKKGNEWHFGMRAHSVETTAANISDIEAAHKLIREDDEAVTARFGKDIAIVNGNGNGNMKDAEGCITSQHITQYWTRPKSPKEKPFVERLIGTLQRECLDYHYEPMNVGELRAAAVYKEPMKHLGYIGPLRSPTISSRAISASLTGWSSRAMGRSVRWGAITPRRADGATGGWR